MEKIGLEINPNDLKLYYTGRSDTEKVFWDDYYIKIDVPDIQSLVLQKEKVESVCWLSIDEIKSLMNEEKFAFISLVKIQFMQQEIVRTINRILLRLHILLVME